MLEKIILLIKSPYFFLAVFLLILMLFSKTVATIIIWFKKDHTEDLGAINLDALIESKKHQLRNKEGLPPILPTSPLDPPPPPSLKNRLEDLYIKNANKISDFKEIMILFDAAKWGDGKNLEKISSEITNYGIPVPQTSELTKVVTEILQTDLILKINGSTLPSFQSLFQIITTRYYFKYLVTDLNTTNKQFIKTLAMQHKVPYLPFLWATIFVLFKSIGTYSASNLYSLLLTKKLQIKDLSNIELDLILTNITTIILKTNHNPIKQIINEIIKEAEIFLILLPLPKLRHKDDFENAYAILQASPDDSFDTIHKKYKKIAMQKHPDRLGGKIIPAQLIKEATNNFKLIQEAYNLLKNKM